jgi:putative GTP pyrophosphokinase
MEDDSYIHLADMRNGKVNDDGYRGIHLYKNIEDNNIGKLLREKYDNGEIKNEEEFKEDLLWFYKVWFILKMKR